MIVGLSVLPFSSTASASPFFSMGLGVIFDQMGRSANKNTGEKGLLGTIHPALTVNLEWESLKPGIAYTLLGKTGPDGSYKRRMLVLSVPYLFSLGERTFLKVGASYLLTFFSGASGDVTLNNGEGTAVFSRPGQSSVARNLAVDLGISMPIIDQTIALDLDFHCVAPASSRRSLSTLVQLAYQF